MRKEDLDKLVSLADTLDEEGKVKEADALEGLLRTSVAEADEEEEKSSGKNGLNGKATRALESLKRTLESFTSKNLDSRGPIRRTLNKVIDSAEDLLKEINTCLGEK